MTIDIKSLEHLLVNRNYLHAAVLLKELTACGVRRAVISPGSRSTPLAWTAESLSGLETTIIIDERSAAYFALGLAKAGRQPVALICTSGTAAVNYYPAVVEASQGCVPLILLTADRPAELRGTGAPQTIDQHGLYGRYVRSFIELPEPNPEAEPCRTVRNLARQIYFASMTEPLGPVHINVPFDEPLAPFPLETEICRSVWKEIQSGQVSPGAAPPAVDPPDPQELDRLTDALTTSQCGLIIAGPESARTKDEAAAVHALGRALGWPILADVVSGLRFFSDPVLPYYDIFLRDEIMKSIEPDVVLAFGAFPTSKVLNGYLDAHRSARTFRIQPHRLGQDPTFRATDFIQADPASLCRELTRLVTVSRDSLLLDPFMRVSGSISAALAANQESACEATVLREAVRTLPDDSRLMLASSLPVRYADALLAAEGRHVRVYAQRGANGIDGTVSAAAGVAAASDKPTLLVTGDLAFLHDLTGLTAAARHAPDLKILLLNNNGGGIFHFLPVAGFPEHFEKLQATPHNLDLSAAKDLFGLDWQIINSPQEAQELFMKSGTGKPQVLEYRSDRRRNHEAFTGLIRKLMKAAAN